GPAVHHHVESVSEESRVVRFLDGGAEATPRLHVLAADVHEAERGADRARGDEHALDQRMRIALEQIAVLERSGLALVRIDDEIDRARVRLRNERPLRPGWEARASEAA